MMWTIKLFRVRLQQLFRKTGLLPLVEHFRYYQKKLKYWKSNNRFLKENPDFALPPDNLAYDAYNAPKWKYYKYSGENSAKFIKQIADKYFGITKPLLSIYEWGCGPARIIRHLPSLLGNSVQVFGSDYNKEMIEWCQKNIPGIYFTTNELNPPLNYPDNNFDFIYCVSVFTHLSGETGIKWADELFRVLKPGGILIITNLGGHSFKTELLPREKRKYLEEGIVERGQFREGKKMYLTFHSSEYIQQTLLKKFTVLEHLSEGGFPHVPQECWIVRRY